MAIQNRRGQAVDFVPSKMLPGEFAVSLDNRKLYMCFASGTVKEVALTDDVTQAISTASTSLGGRIAVLESASTEQGATLLALVTRMGTAEAAIRSHDGRLVVLENDGTNIKARLSDVESETATLDELLTDLNLNMITISNDVEGLKSNAVRFDTVQNKSAAQKLQARENTDSAGIASLATAYSPSAKYAVGDMVTYDGKLYTCKTAITTAEAWNSSHWTEVTVGDQLSDLKDDLEEITEGSEIEVDRSNFVNMSGYFIGGTYNTIQQSAGTAMMYIPCYPNTRYTISKVLSDRFVIAYTTTTPQAGMAPSDVETHNDQTSVDYQTGSDAAYLCVYYRRATDALSESEIYNSITISYPGGTGLTAVDKVARRELQVLASQKSLSSYGDISTATGFVTAFNAAMADETISGLSIPFGTYNVNSALNITRSNITIDGNGCTLNMRDDNGNPVNSHCFVINNKSRITIRNFLINMRQSKYSTSGTTFYFLDANFVKVEKIDIYQIGCRGALIFNSDSTSSAPGSQKIFFKNVKFRGINEQNTTASEWPCGIIAANLKDSGFEDCVVSGMCRFTLEFKNYAKNCYMKNNVIYGSDFTYEHESGLALGGDRPDSETILGDGLVFVGNVVRNCKYPLYLGRVANSVFNDNVFEGQIHAEKLQSCVINGNVIKSTDKYSIPLIRLSGCEDLLMSENLYDPGQNDLFYIPQANTNVLVKGYMNGHEINVPNPTSGTPTLT